MNVATRFWAKVAKGQPNECWLWTACRNSDGYGQIGHLGRVVGAHRISWMLEHGEMPALFVLHKCDTPACVNPGHLFLGDDAANTADKMAKGRWRGHNITGNAHWNTKIRDEQIPEILMLHASGISGRELGRRYCVVHECIRKIIDGRRAR